MKYIVYDGISASYTRVNNQNRMQKWISTSIILCKSTVLKTQNHITIKKPTSQGRNQATYGITLLLDFHLATPKNVKFYRVKHN
jgi:hypothetical protein